MGREPTMIPANIMSKFFTQVAADNADCGQESNSQRIANAVLYQYWRFRKGVSKKPSFLRKKETHVSVSIPDVPIEEFRAVQNSNLATRFLSKLNI